MATTVNLVIVYMISGSFNVVCVCVFQRFGPLDQDYYYKKTDEAQADARQEREEDVSRDEGETLLLLYTELWS